MSQLILAVHTGIHDAAAAVLVDYDVKAAVQLERLTRFKGDGRTYPDLCIEELLDMVGATRRDVDVLALTRSDFPVHYFHHFRGYRWIREHFRTYAQGKKTRFIPREARRANTPICWRFLPNMGARKWAMRTASPRRSRRSAVKTTPHPPLPITPISLAQYRQHR